VEITGQTVYGTAGGNEQMLAVVLDKDGTCKVTPSPPTADLLTDTGTWKGTESESRQPSRRVRPSRSRSSTRRPSPATAADFGIADFDTINFDFYG